MYGLITVENHDHRKTFVGCKTVEQTVEVLVKNNVIKVSYFFGGEQRILYRRLTGGDPETLIDVPDVHIEKFNKNDLVFCESDFIPSIGRSVIVNVFTLEELCEKLRSLDDIGIKSASKLE